MICHLVIVFILLGDVVFFRVSFHILVCVHHLGYKLPPRLDNKLVTFERCCEYEQDYLNAVRWPSGSNGEFLKTILCLRNESIRNLHS